MNLERIWVKGEGILGGVDGGPGWEWWESRALTCWEAAGCGLKKRSSGRGGAGSFPDCERDSAGVRIKQRFSKARLLIHFGGEVLKGNMERLVNGLEEPPIL
jgi:hypothetical protein